MHHCIRSSCHFGISQTRQLKHLSALHLVGKVKPKPEQSHIFFRCPVFRFSKNTKNSKSSSMKPFVEFPNGQKMPIVGLGLFMRQEADRGAIETSMNAALEAGYRHFDTAYFYMNEGIIGKVLKGWFDSGKIKREEIFITTKLPSIAMKEEMVENFLKKSLTALQLDYVDLYLVHGPWGFQYVSDEKLIPRGEDGKVLLDKCTDLLAIWAAMEKQVCAGRAKSIGISNFNEAQVERLVKAARIIPQNIQVELNAYFQQKPLREVCAKHGITVCAYGALGSMGRKEFYDAKGILKELPAVLTDPVVGSLSQKYGKSPAQILLRFLAQQGIVVIPKSANPQRVKENFDIFDFALSDEDMVLLKGLDKGSQGRSFDFDTMPGVTEHPEYPF